MCFKKPQLPGKTPEDIQAEKDLEEARIIRKQMLARELKTEKDSQTEAALARALGFVGNRSLITGPKGGAGFIGAGSGRVVNRTAASSSSGSAGGATGAAGSGPRLVPPSLINYPKRGSGGSGGGGSPLVNTVLK